jgi:hypothetical protein
MAQLQRFGEWTKVAGTSETLPQKSPDRFKTAELLHQHPLECPADPPTNLKIRENRNLALAAKNRAPEQRNLGSAGAPQRARVLLKTIRFAESSCPLPWGGRSFFQLIS